MNIEQIFKKPLKRNINGVVKAEQTDDASAYIELDEYVITRELENHSPFLRILCSCHWPGKDPYGKQDRRMGFRLLRFR